MVKKTLTWSWFSLLSVQAVLAAATPLGDCLAGYSKTTVWIDYHGTKRIHGVFDPTANGLDYPKGYQARYGIGNTTADNYGPNGSLGGGQ